jgi:amino-acid N-acetyltransferase
MSIVIRVAEAQDEAKISRLLMGAGVETAGLVDNIGHFLIVEQEQEDGGELSTVGTVGLEVHEGRFGLMRSFVLKQEAWNAQVGFELLRLFLAYAHTAGIEKLYLLTQSTALPFFIHMGFSTIAQEDVPEAVSQSPHFSTSRREGVQVMVKEYSSTSYPHGAVDIVDK